MSLQQCVRFVTGLLDLLHLPTSKKTMEVFGRNDTVDEQTIFTPWSLVHVAVGAASKTYVSFETGELLHAAYEVVGSKRIFNILEIKVTEESSFVNSLGDQLAFTVGRFLPGHYMWGAVSLVMAYSFVELGVEF